MSDISSERGNKSKLDLDIDALEGSNSEEIREVELSFEREYSDNSGSETSLVKDCLDYWKKNHTTYVILSKLCDIFKACPGTSVSSERPFSKSGYQLCERRNRLASLRLEMIIFIQENYELLLKERKNY